MVSSHMVIYAAESSLKIFIPLFVMLLLMEVEAFMWPDSIQCTPVFGFFICKAVGAHWWKLCGVLLAGVMGAHLVADFADGSSNVHEVWKFFFKQEVKAAQQIVTTLATLTKQGEVIRLQ